MRKPHASAVRATIPPQSFVQIAGKPCKRLAFPAENNSLCRISFALNVDINLQVFALNVVRIHKVEGSALSVAKSCKEANDEKEF